MGLCCSHESKRCNSADPIISKANHCHYYSSHYDPPYNPYYNSAYNPPYNPAYISSQNFGYIPPYNQIK